MDDRVNDRALSLRTWSSSNSHRVVVGELADGEVEYQGRSDSDSQRVKLEALPAFLASVASAEIGSRSVRREAFARPCTAIAASTLICALLATASTHAATRGDLDAAEIAAVRTELAAVLADEDADRDRFDAEVWLLAKDAALSRLVPDPDERLTLLGLVWHEAHRHEIDPELALAVIEVESTFDRFAVSTAGAQGLMQVMPFWKKELGRDDDNLTDARTNVRYG